MGEVIICLLNMVLWAGVILFALWLLTLILSPFFPGISVFNPFSAWPGAAPPAPRPAVFSALLMFIGVVLLLNFILCAFFKTTFLPLIWSGR